MPYGSHFFPLSSSSTSAMQSVEGFSGHEYGQAVAMSQQQQETNATAIAITNATHASLVHIGF